MESVIDIAEMYERILEIFICKDDERKFLQNPFLIGDNTAATNAYAMVVVTGWKGNYIDQSDKVKGIYPIEINNELTISKAELEKTLSLVPLVDDYDMQTRECAACAGEGEVEFDFEYKGEIHSTLQECPVCDGMGVTEIQLRIPNGKKILNERSVIQIGNSLFLPDRIKELLKVMDVLKEKEIMMVSQTNAGKGSLFKIANVEVLLMPSLGGDKMDIAAGIY